MARRGRPPYPGLLTPREVEVLALLREGLTNEAISERLGISLAGAKYHVSEILGKLGVETRKEAALWQPRPRPWWAGIVAPIAFVWRKAGSGPVAAAGAATVVLLIAAGVGLLVWGLLRTSGGSASVSGVVGPTGTPLATAPAIVAATIAAATPTAGAPTATVAPIGTVGTACPGGPTIPASSTPLFAYAAPDKTIWVANADGTTNEQIICSATSGSNAAWSTDGKYIAHAGDDGSLRAFDVQTGQDTVLDNGTEGAIRFNSSFTGLQWSAGSDDILYEKVDAADPRVPTGIWKASVGTPPLPIVQDRNIAGFAWSPDGQRIVYQIRGTGQPQNSQKGTEWPSGQLFVTNPNGTGTYKVADGDLYSPEGEWSPDGRLLAYWTDLHGGSAITGSVYAIDMETGRQIALGAFSNDQDVGWAPSKSRHVFYSLSIDLGSASASPLFDPKGTRADWSPDGTKVAYLQYAPQPPTPDRSAREHSLVILDLATGLPNTYETSTAMLWVHQPGYVGTWSPDGRYYAFIGLDPKPDGTTSSVLYVADTSEGSTNRVSDGLTFGAGLPNYAPDGSHLLVQQGASIWSANPDGSGLAKLADGTLIRADRTQQLGWRPSQ